MRHRVSAAALRPALVSSALAALCVASCAPLDAPRSAFVLRPDERQVSLGADLVDGEGASPKPDVHLGYRTGLSPRVDLGTRLWILGGELDVGVQLAREEHFALALAPAVGLSLFQFVAHDRTTSFDALLDSPEGLSLGFWRLPLVVGLRDGTGPGSSELTLSAGLLGLLSGHPGGGFFGRGTDPRWQVVDADVSLSGRFGACWTMLSVRHPVAAAGGSAPVPDGLYAQLSFAFAAGPGASQRSPGAL